MAETQPIEDTVQTEEVDVGQKRHCDFYISPRGCIKGDQCDFLHPVAPNGNVTTRVCDFYKSPRGCAKNKECDFLHIDGLRSSVHSVSGAGFGMGGGAPAGQKVCSFFNSPRGCIKGAECDFFHPTGGSYGGGGMPGMEGGMPGTGSGRGAGKLCDYFFSARGCVKGSECDFSHVNPAMGGGMYAQAPGMFGQQMGMGPPMRPMGAMGGQGFVEKKPQKCDFFNTERGCIKGDMCDFIHVKDKVCDFFLSERGCRKGKFCDFQHPEDGAAGGETKPRAKRYAPY